MSSDPLSAVGARRLSDHVAAVVEERILAGRWEPGRRLPPEHELGRQLNVSRAVVRDAVQALAARGLLEVRHGVGTSVAQPSDRAYTESALTLLLRGGTTVRDALLARVELEVVSAGLAARSRTDDDLAVLDAQLAAIVAAAAIPDVESARAADLQFHTAILEATHLPVLVALLRPLRWIIQRTSVAPAPDAGFLDVEIHGNVLEALRSGDEATAAAAMRDHFGFVDDPRYAALHDVLLRDAPAVGVARAEIRGVA